MLRVPTIVEKLILNLFIEESASFRHPMLGAGMHAAKAESNVNEAG